MVLEMVEVRGDMKFESGDVEWLLIFSVRDGGCGRG